MLYRNIPVEVEAFQHTRMNTKGTTWPEWLVNAWNSRNRTEVGSFYSQIKYNPTTNKQNTVAFYIVDKYGDTIEVEYGDYILYGKDEYLSVCRKQDFDFVPID